MPSLVFVADVKTKSKEARDEVGEYSSVSTQSMELSGNLGPSTPLQSDR
jgi:hypothetical protein